MTGRERIHAAFHCRETDRVPWVPFVGCHAGALIQASAADVLRSADLLVRGIDTAVRRYAPDGIPVMFDLQIEAELLGCSVTWADENPPAVSGHVLTDGRALESLSVPSRRDGRLALALDATGRLRKNHPDIALYGLITGPFTLALHLLGTDIFMKMFDDPAMVHSLMGFCAEVGRAVAGYYVDAGCDIVAVVDPMTSQIGPDQFREFVTRYAQTVFSSVRERGALSSFFVCGHAQQNIEAMCECGPDNISVDENIPLEFVRDVCLKRSISFGGNMQLTSVLLLGTPVDAQRNALACLDIGGTKGFVLAPGCDLPYATPAANLEAVAQLIHDPYQRNVVRAIASDRKGEDLLNLSEYGQGDRVIVDIITLDSEACAPCQYMVEAVKAVTPEFEGIVEWREHKIKHRESLVFMTSLMVRNVPTICIDGTITFVSRIPARDDLIAAIQKRINEKLRVKIQRRKASIYILGEAGADASRIETNVQQAVKELGADVHVVRVTDPEKFASYGFTRHQMPVTVMARYATKTVRAVPDIAIVKEWIKDVM